ncbi:methyltransferase domain-containing protein [Spirillospora sp. CA-253888]
MTAWCWLLTCVPLLDAVRLRRRLARLPRLPDRTTGGSPSARSYDLVTADGVTVHERVRRAAAQYAGERGLAVLDLVPAGLPVQPTMDLARSVDPRAYRSDRTGLGRGAGHAILIDSSLMPGLQPTRTKGLGPGEMAEVTVRAKQHTVSLPGETAADLAVADIPPFSPPERRRTWLTALSLMVPQTFTVPRLLIASMTGYALLLSGLLEHPWWGLLPIAAYCAVPYLVTVGLPVRPRDLHRAAWLRLFLVPLSWWRTARSPRTAWDDLRDEQREKSRIWHRERLAAGGFFEPRRTTCPWCGSQKLGKHLLTRDTMMLKPGRFTLDRCADCRHIFQNPRLSGDGLDFYYRDVYDGLSAPDTEHIFSAQTRWYRKRAELVAAHTAPLTWLDVGAGHGHFCATAAGVLPGTVFDGLDIGAGIEEAVRRGWVRHGIRGEFRAVSAELPGRHDVISMNHYLEHTADPAAELDAARTALAPGGHLLVELPDPDAWTGRVLRGLWIAWLPPQHLHMIPMSNLTAALVRRGFEIVSTERDGVRVEDDFTTSALLLANVLGPDPRRPWADAPLHRGRARRAMVATAVAPVVIAAFAVDRIVRLFRPGNSNAYRVLARKPDRHSDSRSSPERSSTLGQESHPDEVVRHGPPLRTTTVSAHTTATPAPDLEGSRPRPRPSCPLETPT